MAWDDLGCFRPFDVRVLFARNESQFWLIVYEERLARCFTTDFRVRAYGTDLVVLRATKQHLPMFQQSHQVRYDLVSKRESLIFQKS